MSNIAVAANPIVCRCLGVREAQIRDAVVHYACDTVKEVGQCTKAGRGCNVCHCKIRQLIAEAQQERALQAEEMATPE